MYEVREAWGKRWAHRLTSVMSALINSAHLLTHMEFIQAARDWSGRRMVSPYWWRDLEDRFRDEEFGYDVKPVDFSIVDDLQAFWDGLRAN